MPHLKQVAKIPSTAISIVHFFHLPLPVTTKLTSNSTLTMLFFTGTQLA